MLQQDDALFGSGSPVRRNNSRTTKSQIVLGSSDNTYTSSYASANSNVERPEVAHQYYGHGGPNFVADKYKKTDIFGLVDSGDSDTRNFAQANIRRQKRGPTAVSPAPWGGPGNAAPYETTRYGQYQEADIPEQPIASVATYRGRPYGNYSNLFGPEDQASDVNTAAGLAARKGSRRHFRDAIPDSDILNVNAPAQASAQGQEGYYSARRMEAAKSQHSFAMPTEQQQPRRSQAPPAPSTFAGIFGEAAETSYQPSAFHHHQQAVQGNQGEYAVASGISSEQLNARAYGSRRASGRGYQSTQIFF